MGRNRKPGLDECQEQGDGVWPSPCLVKRQRAPNPGLDYSRDTGPYGPEASMRGAMPLNLILIPRLDLAPGHALGRNRTAGSSPGADDEVVDYR